jgi:hypothetical protein
LGYAQVNTGTPVLIGRVPAGCYVSGASIHVGIAFQDAGGTAVVGDVVFTVGTDGVPDLIYEGDDNQPTVAEDYPLEDLDILFADDDLLYVTPTTTQVLTRGSATIRVTICASNTDWIDPALYHAVFLGGGTWSCTATGGGEYTVAWDADLTITHPQTGKKITVADANVTHVPDGDFLYVVPVTYPVSDETLTMSTGSTVPAGSIAIAKIVSGGVFVIPTWQENGSGGGGDTTFDVTITTDSAASGGICTGSISLGVLDGTFDYFHVQATSACRSAVIQWYADAAMTDRVYNTEQRDLYTGNGHEDWTPGSLTRATPLVGGLIYYKITNYSTASAFTIHIRGAGR